MKTIPLTKGKEAIVDDEDFDRVNQHSWQYSNMGYARCGRTGRYMHRFILDIPDELCVDHINKNTVDNRRSNLRICTRLENQRYQKFNKSNTTGFKGVSVEKRTKRFVAYINAEGKHLHLGSFDCPRKAARAYDEAALKHFGEFALTNAAMGRLTV